MICCKTLIYFLKFDSKNKPKLLLFMDRWLFVEITGSFPVY